jgi:hypothetical protein
MSRSLPSNDHLRNTDILLAEAVSVPSVPPPELWDNRTSNANRRSYCKAWEEASGP